MRLAGLLYSATRASSSLGVREALAGCQDLSRPRNSDSVSSIPQEADGRQKRCRLHEGWESLKLGLSSPFSTEGLGCQAPLIGPVSKVIPSGGGAIRDFLKVVLLPVQCEGNLRSEIKDK